MDNQVLEEIGLTKGESRIYLTLLKLNETTTGKIIENAEISAGKVYQILDKLIKKGLVSYIVKDKTKYFRASNPNRILNLLNEQKNEINNKEKRIKKILPELINAYSFEKKNNETTLFRGIKGIQTAIFELLDNETGEIYAMGLVSSKDDKYNLLWEKWHKERERRKIKCKCLFSEINEKYLKKLSSLKNTEIKLIPGITPSAITISKEYVLIQTYAEEAECLLIRNSNIAKSFQTFFQTMWLNWKNTH
jgi:sugar-specific transcriptional regulator TrmB